MTGVLQEPNTIVLAILGIAFLVLVAVLGRRLSITVGNVHAELVPNGGSSVRDAIDRIEGKADRALERIAAVEAATTASTTVAVNQQTPPEG